MWQIIFDDKALTISFDPIPQFAFGLLGDVGQTNNFVTREITIAKSPEANSFFEHINLPNVQTDFAKREHVIHLTYNSAVILQNARLEKFESRKDSYRIILAAWNRNLTEILSSKLSALDWFSYNLHYPVLVIDDVLRDSGYAMYKYAPTTPHETDGDGVIKLLPYITFKAIFENILAKNDLTLVDFSQADIINSDQLARSAFQMTTLRAPISTDFFSITAPANLQCFAATTHTITFENFSNAGSDSNFSAFKQVPTYDYEYVTASRLSDFDITLNPSVEGPIREGAIERFVVTIALGVGITPYLVYGPWAWTDFPVTFRAAGVAENSIIKIKYTKEAYSVQYVGLTEFSGTNLGISEITTIFDTYSFKNNLPDITQLQFFETILNQFGLFSDYDALTRTIILTDYQYYKQKFAEGVYLDWTDKICNYQNGIDLDETGAFAKKNTYRYSNKSPIADEFAGYDLLFVNNNVPETRVAYKAPFPVMGNDSSTGFYVVAPYLVPDNSEPPIWDYQTLDPFFCILSESKLEGVFALQLANFHVPTEASVFWADLIERQTDYLAEINSMKIYELEIKLSDQDIRDMTRTDIRYPIVLNAGLISGVFKINWVKYRANGISEISIFKLNG